MELEEMKSKWLEMSAEIEKQKKLTDSLIIKMTQTDYRRKLDKVRLPELISSVICALAVIYILLNFRTLDNWYLISCGIASLLILSVLPVLSLRAISRMRSLKVSVSDYRLLLIEYSRAQLNFIRVQKASFILTFILMLALLPVMVKFLGRKNVLPDMRWILIYAIGFVLFYFLATPVYRYYKKSTKEAGIILEDLAGEQQ